MDESLSACTTDIMNLVYSVISVICLFKLFKALCTGPANS